MPAGFDPALFLASLTEQAGVYQMLDENENVIYVGKAKNLKKRVSSYFKTELDSIKTRMLMSHVRDVRVIVTQNENEAFVLENNLIKTFKPKYNIYFRDDKSFPYIRLSMDHEFPRLDFYRGKKQHKHLYFGPYPSSTAVRDSLKLLQKIFKLRQCSDVFFSHRSRPCLQYQIGRCSAPCVNYINKEDYRLDVNAAIRFLEGKNQEILDEMANRMHQASEAESYEQAAKYRDQITQLREIQKLQYASVGERDADVLAVMTRHGITCVELLWVREGNIVGNHSYFPKQALEAKPEEVLAAFLTHYYFQEEIQHQIPPAIIVNREAEEMQDFAKAISAYAKKNIKVIQGLKQEGKQWIAIAEKTAEETLNRYLMTKMNYRERLLDLQEVLHLSFCPERIECFDVSHTQGEETVASCVILTEQGIMKSEYRRFLINGIQPGDDYAALEQALTRRYRKLKDEESGLPDILLIDGGKGQLSVATSVLQTLQISGIVVIGIAKGPERKPGFETLFIAGQELPLHLKPDSPALHVLQQIRDEAHRFAITGHRLRRDKKRVTSTLENIAGIGKQKRLALLSHFGGIQAIQLASVEELSRVKGIHKKLAQLIYDYFHQ